VEYHTGILPCGGDLLMNFKSYVNKKRLCFKLKDAAAAENIQISINVRFARSTV
jgi:hypothetical protein